MTKNSNVLASNIPTAYVYTQNRYKELTGWECPKRGGLTSKQLTEQQKEIDRTARLKISADLGHSREAVTAVYLGR